MHFLPFTVTWSIETPYLAATNCPNDSCLELSCSVLPVSLFPNTSHWWSGVISASQFKHLGFISSGVNTRGAGKGGKPFAQGEIGWIWGEFTGYGGLLSISFSGDSTSLSSRLESSRGSTWMSALIRCVKGGRLEGDLSKFWKKRQRFQNYLILQVFFSAYISELFKQIHQSVEYFCPHRPYQELTTKLVKTDNITFSFQNRESLVSSKTSVASLSLALGPSTFLSLLSPFLKIGQHFENGSPFWKGQWLTALHWVSDKVTYWAVVDS